MGSQQNSAVQNSQTNLSTGGNLQKYNVKNGNFTYKAAGKNLAGGRADKLESNRIGSNRNPLQGNVSASVQVQSMRQLAAIGQNSNKHSGSVVSTKRSYAAVNSVNSAQAAIGGRKMSHPHADMFNSMNTEQYRQKLIADQENEAQQLKTNTMIGNELGPLDISGAYKEQRAGRKDSKLALNKKLIKPLTGNKTSSGQSQQNLVFPAP